MLRRLNILIIFIIASCNYSPVNSGIDEGSIEYNIEFTDNEDDKTIIQLLPNTMTLHFKQNKTAIDICGFMGLFRFQYITNPAKDMNASLLQLFDKRYVYSDKCGIMAFGFDEFKSMQIEYTDDEKKIAGYTCQQAIITFPENKNDTIIIYYTNDINIQNPNINNPFHEVPGVLLQFEVILMNIKMKFAASKVKQVKIPDSYFALPKESKLISRNEMSDIMKQYTAISNN